MTRQMPRDPRTVARDIPSIMDTLFPQLVPGVVVHFNSTARGVMLCDPVLDDVIGESALQHAMLFELAVAVGEQCLDGREDVDWDAALALAIKRQRKHFDARVPDELSSADRTVASLVGENLWLMLEDVAGGQSIRTSPRIHGYQWIASGSGDFSCRSTLIEVKCAARRFGASDYRQILIYWLLSYAASVQGVGDEWETGVLLNPRRNELVEVRFDELIATVGAGRTKVEILELFSWLVGDHCARAIERS